MILMSRGIAAIPGIDVFLADRTESYAGWGRKASGDRARRRAAAEGRSFLLLEDGFIRSVERNDPTLSLVLDELGIYYDCHHPSRLERLISQPLEPDESDRARAVIAAWRDAGASKYNGGRDALSPLPGRYVLVCDQTQADASIRHGGADGASFRRMLDAALAEAPDCKVVVKTHPDVLTGRKAGYFDAATACSDPRIQLLAENCHAASLLERAAAVYTVTSQMGFEALIWGRPVRCFGMPFYAGWGMTADDLPAPARRRGATLDQLVHAALVRYPRYCDPETGQRCEVERILSHIGLQRHMRRRFPARIHALGFSRWKRGPLARFLAGSSLALAKRAHEVPAGATVALWGRDAPRDLSPDTGRIHLEDGFLRSVGLGAELTQPLSWVCDDIGLYYDAARPSRLEAILSETVFEQDLLARASRLRAAIIAAGITKYNLDPSGHDPRWQRPRDSERVILVPGQVEDDASIRHGAPGVRRNVDLLRAVRNMHPEAHIVYKPHPDVVAGLRAWGAGETRAADLCNEIVTAVPIVELFPHVDDVHCLTSLAGFEALLRGLSVTCHGLPFYAGWGLTRDLHASPRRSRRLALDELVAGALILYPTYVSRTTGHFTTPERALAELLAWRTAERDRRPSPIRPLLRPILFHGRRICRTLSQSWQPAEGPSKSEHHDGR